MGSFRIHFFLPKLDKKFSVKHYFSTFFLKLLLYNYNIKMEASMEEIYKVLPEILTQKIKNIGSSILNYMITV